MIFKANNRRDLFSKATSREMSRANVELYMTFVDLTMAFVTDSRDGLRMIMAVRLSTQIHSHGAETL